MHTAGSMMSPGAAQCETDGPRHPSFALDADVVRVRWHGARDADVRSAVRYRGRFHVRESRTGTQTRLVDQARTHQERDRGRSGVVGELSFSRHAAASVCLGTGFRRAANYIECEWAAAAGGRDEARDAGDDA